MDLSIIGALNSIMMPLIVMTGIMFALFAFTRFQHESRDRWRAQHALQVAQLKKEDNSESVRTTGYSFLDIDDDKKQMFVDVMNGFSDFTQLRGYNVDLSLDTSRPGKVGVKFTILDDGVIVSAATVKKDIAEFIERVRDGSDLGDLPMATNPVEHARLQAALQTRFAYLTTQIKMLNARDQFYLTLADEMKQVSAGSIRHHPVSITLNNEGMTSMRDNYNATNSQNVAQGKSKSLSYGSTVNIGSTFGEKQQRLEVLADLEREIESANIEGAAKKAALRNVNNAQEELKDQENPRPEEIGNWLKRASTAITTANAAAGLVSKFESALELFGLEM